MDTTVQIDEMLTILSQAPDGQLDKIVTDKLKSLIGKPKSEVKTGVMHAIDMCVNGGLSSGFALQSLNILHEVYLDGKITDFNDTNCPWRKMEKI